VTFISGRLRPRVNWHYDTCRYCSLFFLEQFLSSLPPTFCHSFASPFGHHPRVYVVAAAKKQLCTPLATLDLTITGDSRESTSLTTVTPPLTCPPLLSDSIAAGRMVSHINNFVTGQLEIKYLELSKNVYERNSTDERVGPVVSFLCR